MTEICGDIPLSGRDRWRYLAYGLRQIAQSIGRWPPVRSMHLDIASDEVRSLIKGGESPFRVYTCALAEQVVAAHVSMAGPICDIGCASGNNFRFFKKCGVGHIYLGLDVKLSPWWRSKHIQGSDISCEFAQMSAVDLGLASNSLAFIFSSSALEHIPNVQQAVCEIARAMRPGAYGFHIVPGVWSLFLYLFHGYRRFFPQDLAKLFQEAGLKVQQIWSLGGLASFVLHGIWITSLETRLMPKLFRQNVQMRQGKALRLYSRLLDMALRLDPVLPFAPVGYGVLVLKP